MSIKTTPIPTLTVENYSKFWKPEKPVFENRLHAGYLLGKSLIEHYGDRLNNPLIVGCVRGGLRVAQGVVEYMRKKGLPAELELVIVRKLSLPTDKEYGIGAMGEDGVPHFLMDLVKSKGVDTNSDVMQMQIRNEARELARRQELFRAKKAPSDLSDRTVVIVDEGLSSGATMIAAVNTIRSWLKTADIMIALPVASTKGLNRLLAATQLTEYDLCVLESPILSRGTVWNTAHYYNQKNHKKETDEGVLEILMKHADEKGNAWQKEVTQLTENDPCVVEWSVLLPGSHWNSAHYYNQNYKKDLFMEHVAQLKRHKFFYKLKENSSL